MKLQTQQVASVQDMYSHVDEDVDELHKQYRAHLDREHPPVDWIAIAEKISGVAS